VLAAILDVDDDLVGIWHNNLTGAAVTRVTNRP
jgi:hypothetical protein